jgi:hypothetical protein
LLPSLKYMNAESDAGVISIEPTIERCSGAVFPFESRLEKCYPARGDRLAEQLLITPLVPMRLGPGSRDVLQSHSLSPEVRAFICEASRAPDYVGQRRVVHRSPAVLAGIYQTQPSRPSAFLRH